MNPEQQVQRALKALADHDRPLESRISASAIFARRQPAPRRLAWKLAPALAVAAGLLFYLWPAPKAEAPQPAIVSEVLRPVETGVVEQTPPPESIPAAKPVHRAKRAQAPQLHEVVTDFFPLMDAPPPFERGQLMRVVVPASTMRAVGLPINPERWSERVQADVLVGEEGMARAIRFVSYEQ